MDGFELAARMSYITNALSYCGPLKGHELFKKYIMTKDESLQKDIASSLKKFEALYPYLKLISEKTGKQYTDRDVVEAYWIGNSLLDKFKKSDMQELVEILKSRGLPKSMADKLIADMPSGAIPYHTFHVAYVGVGNVTGHVETTIQNMDNCRVSAGEVVQIIDDKLLVATDTLRQKDKKIIVVPDETKTIVYDPQMIPDIKMGDYVAMHWGFACKKLSMDEVARIRTYTLKSLDAANSVRK